MMNNIKLRKFEWILLIVFDVFRLELVITIGFKYFIPREEKRNLKEVHSYIEGCFEFFLRQSQCGGGDIIRNSIRF